MLDTPDLVDRRDGVAATPGTRPDPALLQLGRALQAEGYRFTTVTPATHARVNARAGNERAATLHDVFGWSRPFASGVLSPTLHALAEAAGAIERHGDRWIARLRASTIGDTLFFHSAYPTTAADAVFFGPDTYRFVAAVEQFLERDRPVRRAVDIGCGAGPGAVAIALRRPAAEVFAVDINDAALGLAAVNAALAGASGVAAVHSDLLTAVPGEFDLIVANPPYLIDPDERVYRHGGGALGEGLSLTMAMAAAGRLAVGGSLVLYTGSAVVGGVDAFRGRVLGALREAGLTVEYREVDPDVFGEELLEPAYDRADRIAAVVVIATR